MDHRHGWTGDGGAEVRPHVSGPIAEQELGVVTDELAQRRSVRRFATAHRPVPSLRTRDADRNDWEEECRIDRAKPAMALPGDEPASVRMRSMARRDGHNTTRFPGRTLYRCVERIVLAAVRGLRNRARGVFCSQV